VGFAGMHILVPREGKRAEAIGEDMRITLFKSWIQCNLRN
jgi:hypothetical protein